MLTKPLRKKVFFSLVLLNLHLIIYVYDLFKNSIEGDIIKILPLKSLYILSITKPFLDL